MYTMLGPENRELKPMKNLYSIGILFALITLSDLVFAQDGFYGGLAIRQNGLDSFRMGNMTHSWNKLAPPTKDEGALLYGGYRWRQLLAVEAAVTNTGNLGLRLQPISLGSLPTEPTSRSLNVDVFTNLNVRPSLSLYGRLGYGYSAADNRGSLSLLGENTHRKNNDGLNLGVGVRYDMTQLIGLRLEWTRFARLGRFSSETFSSGLPETDQVSIGVQYKF